jgi:hypothetical protein
MKQEDIIRMAREAGLYTKCEVHSAVPFDQLLERFAALVRAESVAHPWEPDYKEALRVLSLALEEAPTKLTPKQHSVWRQSKDVLLSGGGLA